MKKIFLISFLLFLFFGCRDMPKYKVRSEEVVIYASKVKIDIELTQKEQGPELLKIAKHYQDKYSDKRLILIWFFVGDNETCYATAHSSQDEDFEGIIFLQDNNNVDLAWLSKTLNRSDIECLGKWIDSTKIEMAFALYKSDTSCIMRTVFLKQKQFTDKLATITSITEKAIRVDELSTSPRREYFIINKNDLELYNSDGNMYTKATPIYN